MGLAIIVPDVDFSDANIGKITLIKEIIADSITIISPDNIIGNSILLNFSIHPVDSSQREVNWEIVEGTEYATINRNGLLTINIGAKNNIVKIKAYVKNNENVYDTKQIVVTYSSSSVNSLSRPIIELSNLIEDKTLDTDTGKLVNGSGVTTADFIQCSSLKYIVTTSVMGLSFKCYRDNNENSYIGRISVPSNSKETIKLLNDTRFVRINTWAQGMPHYTVDEFLNDNVWNVEEVI